MSILLRDLQGSTDECIVMCKGADTTMLPLCTVHSNASELEAVNQSLLDLSNMGLRTLIVAHKKISFDAAQQWCSVESRIIDSRTP